MIILDKKKQEFIFGTLFYGLELLGAVWENGTHIFRIEHYTKGIQPALSPSHSTKGLRRHLGGISGSLGQTLLS
jgi:hypothetical protein